MIPCIAAKTCTHSRRLGFSHKFGRTTCLDQGDIANSSIRPFSHRDMVATYIPGASQHVYYLNRINHHVVAICTWFHRRPVQLPQH